MITDFVHFSPSLSTGVLSFIFFVSAYNYVAMAMLETESFSPKIQSTAVGLIFSLSYTSRICLPYLIGFMNERGIHPIFMCSLMLLFLGITPTFFIEETKNKNAVSRRFDTEFACPQGTYTPDTMTTSSSACLYCPPGEYCEGTGRELPNGNCSEGWFCTGGAYQSRPIVLGKFHYSCLGVAQHNMVSLLQK